jgi:hypothetical protein
MLTRILLCLVLLCGVGMVVDIAMRGIADWFVPFCLGFVCCTLYVQLVRWWLDRRSLW